MSHISAAFCTAATDTGDAYEQFEQEREEQNKIRAQAFNRLCSNNALFKTALAIQNLPHVTLVTKQRDAHTRECHISNFWMNVDSDPASETLKLSIEGRILNSVEAYVKMQYPSSTWVTRGLFFTSGSGTPGYSREEWRPVSDEGDYRPSLSFEISFAQDKNNPDICVTEHGKQMQCANTQDAAQYLMDWVNDVAAPRTAALKKAMEKANRPPLTKRMGVAIANMLR